MPDLRDMMEVNGRPFTSWVGAPAPLQAGGGSPEGGRGCYRAFQRAVWRCQMNTSGTCSAAVTNRSTARHTYVTHLTRLAARGM